MNSLTKKGCDLLPSLPITPMGYIGNTLCNMQEDFISRRQNSNSTAGVFGFINLIVTFFAFFLAFKCISKGGSAVGHILGACCCGILYIAYALANSCL